jgi:glucose/arabinose dehydrogenase
VTLSLALLSAAVPLAGQGLELELQPVVDGLARPLGIAAPDDGTGRLFIVQQTGEILVWNGSEILATPFLDVGGVISCCGERGLLGLALHPGFATNGLFFVNYTDTAGDTVVARYQASADPNLADPASAHILLAVDQPDAYGNHNGGHLVFGPDGYLYVGLGDGGGGGDPEGNGQDRTTLLGSILRIDVDDTDPGLEYAIPPDNPFVGDPGGRDEIWAWGLRNPWRFAFDRATGDLFIGDVGQGRIEEIDFQPAASGGGENYGWNVMEGSTCYSAPTCDQTGLVLPILEYSHPLGRSVTGGFRYRGDAYPTLRGVYLYADYGEGLVWGTVPRCDGAWQSRLLLDTPYLLSSFGEDSDGELYLARYASASGGLSRITVPVGSGGPALLAEPSSPGLGPVGVGDTASAELLLTNTNAGPEALVLTGMTLSDGTHFAINPGGGSSPCGSLNPCLPPGQGCTVELTFSSAVEGTFAGTLAVTGNIPDAAVPIQATAYQPCSGQDHLVLDSQTVSDTRTEEACRTLTAGPYAVTSPGEVTFRAGETVILRDGFSVGAGAGFMAEVDPLLALP